MITHLKIVQLTFCDFEARACPVAPCISVLILSLILPSGAGVPIVERRPEYQRALCYVSDTCFLWGDTDASLAMEVLHTEDEQHFEEKVRRYFKVTNGGNLVIGVKPSFTVDATDPLSVEVDTIEVSMAME